MSAVKKTETMFSLFLLLLICLIGLSALTSCSSKKESGESAGRGTVTIEGVLAENNGKSPEGLTMVFVDEDNNDYSVKIGKGGKFTARGLLTDKQIAVSVEDDNYTGYTKISRLKISVADEVTLGEMGGKNVAGYLSAFCKKDTETLYITFYLDENNYLAIGYLSDECPESETVTVESTNTGTTARSDILF